MMVEAEKGRRPGKPGTVLKKPAVKPPPRAGQRAISPVNADSA